jgi:hypothetical protein
MQGGFLVEPSRICSADYVKVGKSSNIDVVETDEYIFDVLNTVNVAWWGSGGMLRL